MTISWKNCFRVGLSVFLLYMACFYWPEVGSFLSMVLGAFSPLILGFSIAYVLNILMSFYEKIYFPKRADRKFVKKSRRPVCLLGALITLIGIITLIVWLVVPELVSCIHLLVLEIPKGIQKLIATRWIQRVVPESALNYLTSMDWMSYVTKLAESITAGLGGAISTVVTAVSSVFSTVVTVFLGIVFSIYMLISKEKLQRHGNTLLKSFTKVRWQRKIGHFLAVLNLCFKNFIVGQCLEAVILGVLCALGMWIFGFPYATMIGALIGFTALIPVVGAFVGAGIGFIMILTVSPLKAVLFLVFILVLQQLEENLIYPKVVGESIGLPAIWVLAAVTVGGSLMGVLGMLVGVPVAAACYHLLKEEVKKNQPKDFESDKQDDDDDEEDDDLEKQGDNDLDNPPSEE